VLTVAVSSRSLFNMEGANAIFESQGQKAFDEHMLQTEHLPLPPGPAFALVRKLLQFNTTRMPEKPDRVEVVLLSRNSACAGVRVMNSVAHYGLTVEQAVFTKGDDRFNYAAALGADLFLCAHASDAKKALDNGIAAATLMPGTYAQDMADTTLRIAFDGDSVLFSDEADELFREHGLERFRLDEQRDAKKPLGDGPFKRFFVKLRELQASLPANDNRIRTALVTARGGASSGRPINTLLSWGMDVGVAIFADGRPKGPLVRAFRADMLFDDTGRNCESASAHDIPAGLVPFGAGGIVAQTPVGASAPALAS